MLNKLKRFIMPFMLGAFLFGGVGETFINNNEIQVYAAKDEEKEDKPEGEGDAVEHGKIPSIGMGENGVTGLTADSEGIYDKSLTEFRKAVIFISAIGTVCMILFFILNFINLGKSQGNPQERQKAISGLIITGIATAGLGSVTLITSLFYGMLGN